VNRKVVITGMGWVTPLGNDIESTWQRLLNGDCAIDKTTIFDAETFPTTFSAEVRNFDLAAVLKGDYEQHKNASRNSGFAIGAALQAWKDAGLDKMKDLDRRLVGVYLGAGDGPLDFWPFVDANINAWDKEKGCLDTVKWAKIAYEKLDRDREMEQELNMAGAHIAKLFGLRGPNFNCLTACAASTQALGEAAEQISRGDAEVMLSGGTHSMIHPFGVTGFNRLTALSTRNNDFKTSSRPFDRDRDGFVLGEGAGILVLESEEFAKARGAKILAELAGFGSSADAYRITDIHETGRGGIAAMKQALADANVTINDIDYISAHGTGTHDNDKIETLAIKSVFGERAYKVPVSSIKSMMGHLIAAAGAVEAITCVLAIRDQVVPPTINYCNQDPECDLDYVPNVARKVPVKICLSNSFGFGGQNDTIIIRAYNS
jgi:3-oxoacyl-[acyl-carrier-protein] synthase II